MATPYIVRPEPEARFTLTHWLSSGLSKREQPVIASSARNLETLSRDGRGAINVVFRLKIVRIRRSPVVIQSRSNLPVFHIKSPHLLREINTCDTARHRFIGEKLNAHPWPEPGSSSHCSLTILSKPSSTAFPTEQIGRIFYSITCIERHAWTPPRTRIESLLS
jgi:hypothetical protein